MNNFTIILKYICDNVKNSFGSIDIVKTEGVKILEQEGEHWVEFGASNLHEICMRAEEIKSMLSYYDNYDDVREQFVPDIIAISDDLAYHASIFNVYYFSALRRFFKKKQNISNISKNEFAEYLKSINIENITNRWDVNISNETKKESICQLAELSFFICEICKNIKNVQQEHFDLLDELHTFSLKFIILNKNLQLTIE